MTINRLADRNGPIGWKCDRCGSVVFMERFDDRDPLTVRWDHTCASWEPASEHPQDGSAHQWTEFTTLSSPVRTHHCVNCTATMTEPRV